MKNNQELDEIAALNDESRLDYVLELLKNDPREIVRESAAQCLKSFISQQAAEKVVELFYSDDAYVRNTATTILAKYWPLSCPALTKALKDKSN